MRSEKLYHAITEVDDALVEEAGNAPAGQRKKKPLRLRWVGAIAAVLALAILATVLLRPGNLTVSAYALEKPVYPACAPYPLLSENMNADEEAFREAMEALRKDWEKRAEAQKNYSIQMLDSYLCAAIPAYLGGCDGENAACSPVNLYLSLAMLAETTDAESRAQILSLLGTDSMDSLRQTANSIFLANYRNDGVNKSLLASAIWLRDDMDYNAETVKRLAEVYYAASFRGTMGSEDYDKLLRQWLNEQTDNLLAGQADGLSFDPNTVLALTTTVDFAAKWNDEFRPERTIDGIFHAPNGEELCRMMRQSDTGSYCWGEQFGATSLPLVNGGYMRFLLPDEGVSPEALLRDPEAIRYLLTTGYGAWENSKQLMIHLSLPKFDISSQLDLADALKGLGVQDVFDAERANFSPLTGTDGVFLSEATHGTRVVVDEEGVTAASYTVLIGAGAAEPPEEEIDFTLDRPFLFAIYGADNLPLFVGIVNHPTGGTAEGGKRSSEAVKPQPIPTAEPPAETEASEEKLEKVDRAGLLSAYWEAVNLLTEEAGDTSTEYQVLQREAGWEIDTSNCPEELTDAIGELSLYTGGHFSITAFYDEDGEVQIVLNYSVE